MTTDSADFYLIVATSIDQTQRTQIQALVKRLSTDWWHQVPDVWVAKGGAVSAYAWMETLRPIIPHVPSGVYVFKLPPEGQRQWAAAAKRSTWEWLESSYAHVGGGPPALPAKSPPAT